MFSTDETESGKASKLKNKKKNRDEPLIESQSFNQDQVEPPRGGLTRCYLCEAPKREYSIIRTFDEIVCRSCLNYEGAERVGLLIEHARGLKTGPMSPTKNLQGSAYSTQHTDQPLQSNDLTIGQWMQQSQLLGRPPSVRMACAQPARVQEQHLPPEPMMTPVIRAHVQPNNMCPVGRPSEPNAFSKPPTGTAVRWPLPESLAASVGGASPLEAAAKSNDRQESNSNPPPSSPQQQQADNMTMSQPDKQPTTCPASTPPKVSSSQQSAAARVTTISQGHPGFYYRTAGSPVLAANSATLADLQQQRQQQSLRLSHAQYHAHMCSTTGTSKAPMLPTYDQATPPWSGEGAVPRMSPASAKRAAGMQQKPSASSLYPPHHLSASVGGAVAPCGSQVEGGYLFRMLRPVSCRPNQACTDPYANLALARIRQAGAYDLPRPVDQATSLAPAGSSGRPAPKLAGSRCPQLEPDAYPHLYHRGPHPNQPGAPHLHSHSAGGGYMGAASTAATSGGQPHTYTYASRQSLTQPPSGSTSLGPSAQLQSNFGPAKRPAEFSHTTSEARVEAFMAPAHEASSEYHSQHQLPPDPAQALQQLLSSSKNHMIASARMNGPLSPATVPRSGSGSASGLAGAPGSEQGGTVAVRSGFTQHAQDLSLVPAHRLRAESISPPGNKSATLALGPPLLRQLSEHGDELREHFTNRPGGERAPREQGNAGSGSTSSTPINLELRGGGNLSPSTVTGSSIRPERNSIGPSKKPFYRLSPLSPQPPAAKRSPLMDALRQGLKASTRSKESDRYANKCQHTVSSNQSCNSNDSSSCEIISISPLQTHQPHTAAYLSSSGEHQRAGGSASAKTSAHRSDDNHHFTHHLHRALRKEEEKKETVGNAGALEAQLHKRHYRQHVAMNTESERAHNTDYAGQRSQTGRQKSNQSSIATTGPPQQTTTEPEAGQPSGESVPKAGAADTPTKRQTPQVAPPGGYELFKCFSCAEHLEDRHFVQCPTAAMHKFCFTCSRFSIQQQRAKSSRDANGKKCFLANERSSWTFMNNEIETIFRESSVALEPAPSSAFESWLESISGTSNNNNNNNNNNSGSSNKNSKGGTRLDENIGSGEISNCVSGGANQRTSTQEIEGPKRSPAGILKVNGAHLAGQSKGEAARNK